MKVINAEENAPTATGRTLPVHPLTQIRHQETEPKDDQHEGQRAHQVYVTGGHGCQDPASGLGQECNASPEYDSAQGRQHRETHAFEEQIS